MRRLTNAKYVEFAHFVKTLFRVRVRVRARVRVMVRVRVRVAS